MKINVALYAVNHLYLRTSKLFCLVQSSLRLNLQTQNSAVNKSLGNRKRVMFKVFHGCANKNNDGTYHVIEKNHICFWPTSRPYWKRARDVNFGVRTRSQELKQKKVKWQDFNRYCRFRGREDIRTWLEAEESAVRYLKKKTTGFTL